MNLKDFFEGIRYYGKAEKVIFKYRLWKYMMIPGILSLLYMLTLLILAVVWFSSSLILLILFLLIGYISYKPVIMILCSPLLGYLSELVEKSEYQSTMPAFDFKEMLRLNFRGLYLNLRNLTFMVILSVFAWLLFFIPVFGVIISPVLLVMIQFYYDGFGLMDYTLERKGISALDSLRLAKQNKLKVMGVGSGFMILMMVPILGWFIAPSYGTVSATLAALDMIKQENPVS